MDAILAIIEIIENYKEVLCGGNKHDRFQKINFVI